jgi:hypothetical protein
MAVFQKFRRNAEDSYNVRIDRKTGESELEFLRRVRELFLQYFPRADRTPETLR